jgi:type II secretion system protein I
MIDRTRNRAPSRGGASRRIATRRRGGRIGLSLLEVILALTILGVSLAVLGELVRLGARAAANARDMTMAQLLCESMMSQVAAQETGPVVVGETGFPDDPEWSYSVDVQSIDQPGLVQVTVTVQKSTQQNLAWQQANVTFQLVRWMIDPDLQPAADPLLGP